MCSSIAVVLAEVISDLEENKCRRFVDSTTDHYNAKQTLNRERERESMSACLLCFGFCLEKTRLQVFLVVGLRKQRVLALYLLTVAETRRSNNTCTTPICFS